MEIYKKYSKASVDWIVENDPAQAEDIETDVVHITIQIMAGKVFQIIKLSIIIINICYFLGLAWLIICLVSRDATRSYQESLTLEEQEKDNTDNFLEYYYIFDNTNYHNVLLGTYYAFTTLSTVGFGDLAPRSDPERLICSMILMVGVAIFSVFLGDFITIIEAYKAINQDLDDSQILDNFIAVMQHYNMDIPLKESFVKRIRDHFDYRWKKDLNQFVELDEGLSHLLQLPIDIQNDIYCKFLYHSFISDFSLAGGYFKFPKFVKNAQGILEVRKTQPYYDWDDQIYREFMMGVLRLLEPRQEEKETIIYLSIEDVDEMFFIMNGTVDIGFEVSRDTKYVLRLPKRNVIGAFNCTFNKKTLFKYKVSKRIEAYTIRK